MDIQDKIFTKLIEIEEKMATKDELKAFKDEFYSFKREHGSFKDQTIDRMDRQLLKLIELEERMDQFATNERVDRLEERIMSGMDQQLVILRRLDQERVFANHRVDCIDQDVEKIKTKLQMA